MIKEEDIQASKPSFSMFVICCENLAVILHFNTFYSTTVVGRLGFRVGVSASYSYFGLSVNKRERLSPRY